MPHGVLYGAIPKTRSQASALPREGCSLAFDQETRAVPPMVEAAVSASFLRQHMEPQLPMALVTSPPTRAFIQSRPEVRRLWDHYIDFDHEMATRRLSDLKQRKPELVRMVDGSMTFLWKLGWLLLSPFQRTVFLDADVLVLERSLVSSLLRRSLRIHEIAFNVDVARPGSLDPSYQTVRSLVGSNNVMRTRPIGNGDRPQPQNAPQFAKGFPPVCSAMIAFRRQPRVRRLLLYAAARLMSMLNPSDLTNASLGIRQTDQEMLWFELITGDEAQQPSTLLLPEEYYCPATSGSRHLLDFLDRLELGIYPWWGYMKSRFNQRAKYADNDADRFLTEGVPRAAHPPLGVAAPILEPVQGAAGQQRQLGAQSHGERALLLATWSAPCCIRSNGSISVRHLLSAMQRRPAHAPRRALCRAPIRRRGQHHRQSRLVRAQTSGRCRAAIPGRRCWFSRREAAWEGTGEGEEAWCWVSLCDRPCARTCAFNAVMCTKLGMHQRMQALFL